MSRRLVIVGHGMATVRLLEHLVESGHCLWKITVLSDEKSSGYNRIMLSPFLAGELKESQLPLQPDTWYQKHNIWCFSGEQYKAVTIDRDQKRVVTAGGHEFPYDTLILATGSRPAIPDIPGTQLEGVTGFRTRSDVERVLSSAQQKQHAIVVGGGLLGLEAACALKKQGMLVSVIHSQPVLMNRQLDAIAGDMLSASLDQRGIQLLLKSRIEAIFGKHNRVSQVVLKNGRTLPADLVIFATGVTPNICLTEDSGLLCGKGLQVDQYLRSSDRSIYGLGECTEIDGTTFGLVEPIYQQARVLADKLSNKPSHGFSFTNSAIRLKVTGIHLFSLGDFQARQADDERTVCMPCQGIYRKLVFRNNRLTGVLLYGDTGDASWYQKLLDSGASISDIKETMIFGEAYSFEAA